jgi:hypothetical protein
MSIEVTGPDGAIHEFPVGTSPDVIKGVMARHYGSPAARQEASLWPPAELRRWQTAHQNWVVS